ncbi:MAG: PD40 domain-containing protein [Anaerolineae bacterium]|nr:PD40 domain-containing protein [Anaerolineae bacterium]
MAGYFSDDAFPTWSSDGAQVLVSSTRQGDGVSRLYIGKNPISSYITKHIIGTYAIWLPTGEMAFTGCDYGWGSDTHCGMWRVSPGGRPQQISDNPNDVPTDATASDLLFLRAEGNNWDVYRVPFGGGTPARLTDSAGRDGPAAFSPDGKTIAFLSDRSGTWALYTMDRQGGSVKKRLDLPNGGAYDAGPHPWNEQRISWGPPPSAPPRPTPTEVGLLPAPKITFPDHNGTVSASRPTTVRWTWSKTLAFNQGFEVRVWHRLDQGPMGVAPATDKAELELNFGYTESYKRHGDDFYFMDVVVVQLNPYEILSQRSSIQVAIKR